MRAAFLDACVIVPSRLRDVLFEIAFIGVYRISWSPGVETELIRTVSRLRRERGIPIPATIEYSARLLHQMNHAFPVARVGILCDSIENYGDLPDLGDAHIIEGALRSGSDVIVTFNLKHFPSALLPNNLTAQHPDEFLLELWWESPLPIAQAIRNIARRTGHKGHRLSEREVAAGIATHTPHFSTEVLKYLPL
ncbi:PIN domain-containing protein [Actinotignum sp. GS-2025g]|uniref:PIN family toxin-antitoxin system n=1 Tax=unclassified Actinotignum TaxID=2632702 RepID=UPI002A827D7A|nr:PIN family toxin-antitoxin system [Actinotignum sp. SLA_B059]MDY5127125.1 PIN family toxin-antitoxin system [Actinotignum sp. SLA_B059]